MALSRTGLVYSLLLVGFLGACAGDQVARLPEPAKPAPAVPPPAVAQPDRAPPPNGRLTVDAREYPWSAMGRLNAGGRRFCTAALIAEKLVLTRAACLFDGRRGQWWAKQDLYFLAGYHSDSYVAGSAVARVEIAPGYDPLRPAGLANQLRNWAFVTLEDPIGWQAGWLGLAWLDEATQARMARGEAQILAAGYRPDWAHAIHLFYGCGGTSAGFLRTAGGPCNILPGERGLPRFLLIDGTLRLVADQYFGASQGAPFGYGRTLASDDGATGAAGRAPQGPQALPLQALDQLLWQLGLLESQPGAVSIAARRAAIQRFEATRGLAASGRVSLDLLGRVIAEAQRRSAG